MRDWLSEGLLAWFRLDAVDAIDIKPIYLFLVDGSLVYPLFPFSHYMIEHVKSMAGLRLIVRASFFCQLVMHLFLRLRYDKSNQIASQPIFISAVCYFMWRKAYYSLKES